MAQAQTGRTYDFDGQLDDAFEDINHDAGHINRVMASYDQLSETLSFHANLNDVNGSTAFDGFWVVMGPGPNPKGHSGELAIFYLDGSTVNAPKLTVYAYNGVNGDTSFADGRGNVPGTQEPDRIASSLLDQSFVNNLTVRMEADGSRTLGFNIDATVVNNHIPKYPGPGGASEWTGAAFGEEIGIWFHPVAGLSTTYQNGYLASLSYRRHGWLDIHDDKTEVVPEPATLVALGAGLGLLARRRRAKKA